MILEVLAASAGLGALAFVIGRRARQRRRTAARAATARSGAAGTATPRGLRVGDVLLDADAEHWLAGALHLEEDGLVMRLFRCPGHATAPWLAQLDAAGDDLARLHPTTEVPDGAVPDALPVAGLRYALRRRGEARVTREGSDVPRGVYRARYIELRGPGGRALLVLDLDDGTRLALVGERVERERLDLLPGGDAPER